MAVVVPMHHPTPLQGVPLPIACYCGPMAGWAACAMAS